MPETASLPTVQDAIALGLMPHPEHAVDELTGASADGLQIFASMAEAVDERVAA